MAQGLKIRHPYDPLYNPSLFGLDNFEPTLTKQSDAESADINVIVQRWLKTGTLPTNLNDGQPQFADVSEIPDYRGCLDIVLQAQKQFAELPSNIRLRFNNDPGAYLAFVGDPKNTEEAIALGIATKRVEPSTGGGDAPPQGTAATPPVGGSTEAGTAS